MSIVTMKRKAQRLNPRLNAGRTGNVMLGGSVSNRRNGGVYNNNGTSITSSCCSVQTNQILKQKSYSVFLKQKTSTFNQSNTGILKNLGPDTSSQNILNTKNDIHKCNGTGKSTVFFCKPTPVPNHSYSVCPRDDHCTFTRHQNLPAVRKQLDCGFTVKSLIDNHHVADHASSHIEKLKSKCADNITKTPISTCDPRYAQ
jgi:hypothetical protein